MGYEIGLSSSTSLSTSTGSGDFIVGGGGKQNFVPWIVLGVVAIFFLLWRK